MYPWFASAFKAGQGERRSDGLGEMNEYGVEVEIEVEDMFKVVVVDDRVLDIWCSLDTHSLHSQML